MGSCIIQHLVRSKSKEIKLHKDSPLGDTVVECYFTGNKNVFSLGWVSAKTENTVVMCSREVNGRTSGVRDLELDLTNWKPIVHER